jgi:broad specificity phosphatase PhoE
MDLVQVWLVRHGESTANAGARGETPAGTPLTARGHEQAARLANDLRMRVGLPTAIVVSPFIRTQQTAAPFSMLADRVPEVWPIQEWIFLDPQRYVGTTYAERQPDVKAYGEKSDPYYVDGPGAESFVQFIERVDAFLEDACARPGKIVAFSHGRFIRGVLWRLAHSGPIVSKEQFQNHWAFQNKFETANCEAVKLRFEKGDWSAVRYEELCSSP